MKAKAALSLLAVVISCCASADEPTPKALDAIQGTWTVLSFTSNGDEVPPSTIVAWQRIVKGTHVVWKDGDKVFLETDIAIDSSPTPMTLDSTIATGDAKGQTMLAIYELKDDFLRVCFAPPASVRPTIFSAAKDSGLLMFTAKRLSR